MGQGGLSGSQDKPKPKKTKTATGRVAVMHLKI
jgi:hypothetical protein